MTDGGMTCEQETCRRTAAYLLTWHCPRCDSARAYFACVECTAAARADTLHARHSDWLSPDPDAHKAVLIRAETW